MSLLTLINFQPTFSFIIFILLFGLGRKREKEKQGSWDDGDGCWIPIGIVYRQ